MDINNETLEEKKDLSDSEINKTLREGNTQKKSKGYLRYLLGTLILCQVLDSYTSDSIPQRVSAVVLDFFPNVPFETGLATYQTATSFISLGLFFVIFLQWLADRHGRKKLLLITTFLMGFIPLLQIFIFEFSIYVISAFFLALVTQADIWSIYINEEAPKGKNARWTTYTFVGGTIGGLLIPIMRGIFITDDPATSNWRGMLILSVILGFALTIVILFTIKETTAFKVKDSKNVDKTDSKKDNLSFKETLEVIFAEERRKGMIGIYLIGVIWVIGTVFLKLVEPYATNYTKMTQGEYNIVLIFVVLGGVVGTIITGQLADRFGRKFTFILYSILMPTVSITAMLFTMNIDNSLFRILLTSLLVMVTITTGYGLWALIIIFIIEMVPTETRGFAAGLKMSVMAITSFLFYLLVGNLILIWGLLLVLIVFSCVLLIIVPITIFVLPETKGRDLVTLE